VSFNELNSVKNYIIHQLISLNINTNTLSEADTIYGIEWSYKSPQELNRSVNEVLLETELKKCISTALTYHKVKHLPFLGL